MQGRDGERRGGWIDGDMIIALAHVLRARTGRTRPDENPRKIASIEIADQLQIFTAAARETRRRRVRELIDAARQAGHPIAADGQGVWLAETDQDHRDYQAWRRKHGLADLAAASRDNRSPAAAQAAGQLQMFD